MRWVIAIVAGGLAISGCAQPAPKTGQPLPHVVMETDLGSIELALEANKAPITSANFLSLVDRKVYVGATFYRTVTLANDNGDPKIEVIQGGVGDGDKRVTPIAHEPTSQTGLHHGDGTISMARFKPGTAGSEFFITIGDQPALDAGAMRNKDGLGFAAFGHVVKGMDVVRAIQLRPATGSASDPYVKGQMINPPVRIISVRRK